MCNMLFCLYSNKTFNVTVFIRAGCGFPGEVIAALGINSTANQVYQLNFSDIKMLQKSIEVSAHNFMTSGKCSEGLETKG